MKEAIFYREWLSLPKKQFRLLAMISTCGGQFEGNFASICSYISVTPQSRNIYKIRMAIADLYSAGYIYSTQSGRTLHLKIKPKETEIKICLQLAKSIIDHNYSLKEQVAWEQVLKLYLWVIINDLDIVTNKKIAADLAISESTVCSAKNVLIYEYETITKKKISQKIGENNFISLGQELKACAWWKEILE